MIIYMRRIIHQRNSFNHFHIMIGGMEDEAWDAWYAEEEARRQREWDAWKAKQDAAWRLQKAKEA
jgi:hypothetical protein